MLDLNGKRCVITGAGRGLGRAFAIRFAEMGATLVLTGRSQEALAETVAATRAVSNAEVQSIVMDLAAPESVARAADEIAKAPIHLLINNGAGWLEGPLAQSTVADIANTVGSAVTGTAVLLRGLIPALRRADVADIVTIVSTSGLPRVAIRNESPAFYAAKRGQAALVEAMTAQANIDGIRSIAVFPPDFDTWDPLSASDLTPDRPIDGADVLDCVLFALSRRREVQVSDIILTRMDRNGGQA